MAYSDSITSPLLPISSTTKENLTSVASRIELTNNVVALLVLELNESMSKLLTGIQGLKEARIRRHGGQNSKLEYMVKVYSDKIAPPSPKLLATVETLDLSLKELDKELEKATLQAPKLLANLDELDLAMELEKELKKRKRESMRKEIVDNLVFIVTFVTCQLVFPRTPFTRYPHLSPWQNWVLVYYVDCCLCLVYATQIHWPFRGLRGYLKTENHI